MKKTIILLITFLILCVNSAYAKIDVVYPKSNKLTLNASSIFFVGNTDANSKFYINSKPVKLWEDNFFVYTVPLKQGKNTIVLKSVKNGKSESKTYVVQRKHIKGSSLPVYKKNLNDKLLYAKTINKESTIRAKQTKKSARVVDLPKNVDLYLEGKAGNYYKIQDKDGHGLWIHKSNLGKITPVDNKKEQKLLKISKDSDLLYNYTKYKLVYPSIFSLNQTSDYNVDLTIYSVGKFPIESEYKIQGYEAYYQGNTLVFRSRKMPKITSNEHPLKGISFFIDAGHGGAQLGAVGPTRVNEKDINLSIAKYLIEDLNKEGANVFYSRMYDQNISLYDRLDMAKYTNSFISLSIHNNSLPDGKDPYAQHGTEVHYYNDNAKDLAQIIQKNLVKDLGLKDNNIKKSSFVMTRATQPISVLLEIAYMINPEEYIKLKDPKFQRNVAKTIKKSLEEYIILINK